MADFIYKMPKKPQGGEKSKYPDEFRKLVAEEYLTTGYSLSQVQERHGLRSRGLIYSFVSWYKRNFDLSSIELDFSKEGDGPKGTNYEKELEEKLKYAKLKIETLESIILIAEQEFKIEIRKKYGAKPSEK